MKTFLAVLITFQATLLAAAGEDGKQKPQQVAAPKDDML